ncbi:ABC transporter ATP-binding protein [bacterium]|nr:ABC transporter ATP-binding protein [bacterium]
MSESTSNKVLLKFLWERIKAHKAWIAASLFFAILAALAQVTMASLVPKFVDDALTPKDWDKVWIFCAAVIGVVFWDGISNFLHRVFIRTATERTVRGIRDEIFNKFLVFSESKLSKHNTGKAVNHIVTDSMVIGLGLQIGADLVREPLIVLGLTGYLFYVNWQLSLVCIVAMGPIAMIGKALGGSARRNQGRIQQSLEDVSTQVIDTMGGLRTAHSFTMTAQLKSEFNHLTQKAYNYLIRLCRVEEMVSPLTKFFTSWVGAALIAFGAYLIIKQESMSTGELIGFITAAGLIQQPLRQLNQMSIRIQQVLAATQRVHGVITEPLDTLSNDQEKLLFKRDSDKPRAIEKQLSLEIKNVRFAYTDPEGTLSQTHALQDINLTIEPGKKVALVGQSGSGKSTLSLLSMRFLDPSEGTVFCNGKDARQWDLRDYRRNFSYVSQDVYLFNRTLRENLLIANPLASDNQIKEALKKANILDFVMTLPKGLDSVLLERASNLSGGEKQRMAIARAFLKDAPFLVLDEATSQLDSHNEKIVQEALAQLMAERSVIVIAHRLSTIKEVDEVIVMNSGRIVEKGSPSKLLQDSHGAFSELWNKQHQNLSM